MKSSDVYLCPGKLQSRFLLGIWAIPDLLAVIVCLLLMIPTRQFILFGGIIGAILILGARPTREQSVLDGVLQHIKYHTKPQTFKQAQTGQKKVKAGTKRAFPFQQLTEFQIQEQRVVSGNSFIYFYRWSPPNTHIMTDEEIKHEIVRLGRLFDKLGCTFSMFATDKLENLDEVKNFYLSLPVRYEYMISDIVANIEKSDVSSASVQRAYYFIYKTKKENDEIYKTLIAEDYRVTKANKAEIALLLRNFFVREFVSCDIYTIAQETANIPGMEKAKAAVFNREIQRRLCPHNLDFLATYGQQGSYMRKTIIIKNFPKEIPPCALKELAKLRGTTFHMRLAPMSNMVARKLVDNQAKLQNVRIGSNSATEQEEALAQAKLIRDFYAEIARNQNKTYYVNIFIEIYGKTKEQLSEKEHKVRELLAGVNTTYDVLRLEQKDAFLSVSPLGSDHFLADANNMPSKTAAALFPFSTSFCLDAHGLPLGMTEDGGLFYLDIQKRSDDIPSNNVFTAGTSGMGKSYLTKKVISMLRMFGVKIYVFDPESEYHDLTRQMRGTIDNCASGRRVINIFEVRRLKTPEDDESPNEKDALGYSGSTPMFYQHLSWLQDLFSVLYPKLDDVYLKALMVLVQDMYQEQGINEDTDFFHLEHRDYPTFTELYQFIENRADEPYKMISSEMMKHILLYIKSAYDGALSPLFNGITNIEAEDFIDFDMRDLMQGSEECQRAVLFNISTYLWNRILLKEGWTMLAIDELHMYLQHPYMRKTLQSMVLRARKYNAMIWCATQQITHCLNPQYAYEVSSLLNSSPIKFLFNLGDVELGEVKKALSLKDGEIKCIAAAVKRHCLVLAGKERYAIEVGTLPYEEHLFGKGGGQ